MQVTKNITLFLPLSLKPLFMFFAGLWFCRTSMAHSCP